MAFHYAIMKKYGPNPILMKRAYTTIVIPALTFGCHVFGDKCLQETIKKSLNRLNRLASLLIANDVAIRAEQQETSGFQSFLMTVFPFLLLIGVWIYFMNRMQGGGRGGAMGFGKSKAKLLTEKQGRVTFDDVAGIDEAKEELEEIVEFLRNPQKFS